MECNKVRTACRVGKTGKSGILLFLGVFLFTLTGCRDNGVSVSVTDRQVETRLVVKQGSTVEQVLEKADIELEKGDIVSPSLAEKVAGENTDILIERYAKVTVVKKDTVVKDIELTGKRVRDAIAAAGINLEENDYINYAPDAYLSGGMNITVEPQYEVSILVDGERIDCLTRADTVSALLEEQEIHLDKKDEITPEMDELIRNGTEIVVKRVSVKRIVEREAIDYDVEVEYSGSMYEDETVEKQSGKKGEKEVVYEVTYVDGKEEGRRVIKETVVKEPVKGIMLKGTLARRRVVSRQQVFDCDGSGHGYYIITWSDGTVEYQDF